MGESKQVRSPELGVIFQITEVEAPTGERLWEIHDVERNRGFRLSMTREAVARLAAEGGVAGAPDDATVQRAILAALERALVTGPGKLSGEMYDLELAATDFTPA